ncbi:hypothetical protein ACLKA7_016251 [Drosophila subpalustris]
MIAANGNTRRENSIEFSEKRSSTGAVVNLKKLLKTFKRIFNHSKSKSMAADKIDARSTCPTEEELQNWLNEQMEARQIAIC